MSFQAQDIIYAAARELGYITAGQTLSSLEAADGLNRLNRLLALWSIRRLYIYSWFQFRFQLTTNKFSYSIGASGTPDVAQPRPIAIHSANLISSENFYNPVEIVTAEKWSTEPERGTRTSPIPKWLYYDAAYPNGNLNLFPGPSSSSSYLELFVWQQLTQLPTLATTFDMPPGYEIAVILNLAIRMASMFKIQPTAVMLSDAAEAEEAVRAVNMPPVPGAAAEAQARAALFQAPPQGSNPAQPQ